MHASVHRSQLATRRYHHINDHYITNVASYLAVFYAKTDSVHIQLKVYIINPLYMNTYIISYSNEHTCSYYTQ